MAHLTQGATRRKVRNGPIAERSNALIRQLQLNGTGWNASTPRAIGVTSCQRRQGVSTMAAQIAASAAASGTGRVLLVDANVDAPSVGRIFAVSGEVGMQNALAGECGAFDCVLDSGRDNLSLMLPGGAPRTLAYDSTMIEDFLDNLKHVFQLVVFDLPAANDYSTCFSMAHRLDGIVMVIEPRHTRRAPAQAVCEKLGRLNAKLIGVVLNKCSDKSF